MDGAIRTSTRRSTRHITTDFMTHGSIVRITVVAGVATLITGDTTIGIGLLRSQHSGAQEFPLHQTGAAAEG